MFTGSDRPYQIFLAILAASGLALLSTLKSPALPPPPDQPFAYAQGYFQHTPKIGSVRVVPFAEFRLLSPVTNESPGGTGNSQSTQNVPAY